MIADSKFIGELETYEDDARKVIVSSEATAEQKEAAKAVIATVESLKTAIEAARPSLDKFDELCG